MSSILIQIALVVAGIAIVIDGGGPLSMKGVAVVIGIVMAAAILLTVVRSFGP